MVYNTDFLVAGLVVLICLLYVFERQKQLMNMNRLAFRILIIVAMVNIMMDIFCTILISKLLITTVWMLQFCVTCLYMLQVLVPYCFYVYCITMRNEPKETAIKQIVMASAPSVIMCVMLVMNTNNHMFFTVTPDREYIRGSLYMVMYYCATLYVLLSVVGTLIHRKKMSAEEVTAVIEFLVISVICLFVQAVWHDLLLTGFGLSIGILMQYLTVHNPYVNIDHLTGSFDDRSFEKWLDEQYKKKTRIHLLAVDVRRLKRINSVYGRSVGNQLLIQIAEKLREIGGDGKVFRSGESRFILQFATLENYEHCRAIAKEQLEKAFFIDGEKIPYSLTICGIPNAHSIVSSDMLISYIEYMVSVASESESGMLIQVSRETMEGFMYRREVECFLPTAIEQDLFELNYQPIYSMGKQEFVSLEALSRLRHPTLGPISPEIFIRVAEENGIITQIGELQFRRACKLLADNPELRKKIRNIKFNLSPAELIKSGYYQKLLDTIREFELPFEMFQFEITETVATEYSDILYQAIADFRKVGVGLCLDDFGSGYANLNAVLKLPFDIVKLDRSLLSGICDSKRIASFYENMVNVLKNLGYGILSEGVETNDELELLSSWGIDLIQGYYFSKPLTVDQLLEKFNVK